MLRHSEQTMDDLLTDPMTLWVMQADGVDPTLLRADLVHVARRIGQRPPPMLPPTFLDAAPDSKQLLADCIRVSQAASLGPQRPDSI